MNEAEAAALSMRRIRNFVCIPFFKSSPLLYSAAPTFVPVDAQGIFVLMCDYTGKEVVE
jgi:hypothetical protein